MKLVTFRRPDLDRDEIGIVSGTEICVLSADAAPAFASMQTLIEAGDDGLAKAREAADGGERVALDDVRLKAPLPVPIQMRDALTFEKHLRQARANRYLFDPSVPKRSPDEVDIPKLWYEQPIYYKCNRFSVSGHGDTILWPAGETRLDFELELAVVIGKSGGDIARDDTIEHIFGFMIFNDFSARDLQIAEMAGGLGPAKGKDFRTANALGPFLVTKDEIGNGSGLEMIARVNGEEWSRGNSASMHHDFGRIIEHVSRNEDLYAGEVIGSGTVGDGCGLELGRFLKSGDIVELEVDGLGILRNYVGAKT